MGRKSGFRKLLDEHLKDPKFAKGYREELAKTGIAIEIASLREKRGMSQAELAKKIGTVQSAIARLENPNYGRASLPTLEKIANALDAKLDIRFIPEKRRQQTGSI